MVRYHEVRAYRNRSMLLHVNYEIEIFAAQWDRKLNGRDRGTEKKGGFAEAKPHPVGMPLYYRYKGTQAFS